MPYIFYDFETSSRDPIGQILSYSFILVDDSYEILDELNGFVKLRRTEIPDIGAILVTGINIDDLEAKGELEIDVAKKMFAFLSQVIAKYGRTPLVGFNSNSFDIQFLRNLLISYGYNPYFSGKLGNLDVFHYAQHLAFTYPDDFDWQLVDELDEKGAYYQFKLESLATSLGLLTAPQSHDAREDVLLTIDVVKGLDAKLGSDFRQFQPVQLPDAVFYQGNLMLAKRRERHFPAPGVMPEKFIYRYYLSIAGTQKSRLVLDLDRYEKRESSDETVLLSCIKYINFNKHFFVVEPLEAAELEYWSSVVEAVQSDPILSTLSLDTYFQKIKKDWDILYQIHELGFDRIDTLAQLIEQFKSNPDTYVETVKYLWQTRKDVKDTYLVQLYNRFYLNYHPNVSPAHLAKYFVSRYVSGDMLRDKNEFEALSERFERLENLVSDSSLSDRVRQALLALQRRMDQLRQEEYIASEVGMS